MYCSTASARTTKNVRGCAVGPFADKDAAQRAQAKIQQQAGVAGAVVTYP